jgi:transglutaminase-like putative cysteine protease
MAVPDDRRTRPQGQQREDHPRPRRRAGAALSSGFVLTSHQEPQPLEKVGLPTPDDLRPTLFIDSDSDAVRSLVERVTAGAKDQHDVVARLFAAIRDGVRYDPYGMSTDPGEYRASAVIDARSGYCVQKAVALTAAARAAGIPSRLGFADVKNHLQSERLRAAMGTDLFVWHGYSTFFVGGRWTKASPAFNAELCARFGVPPLDFDGSRDALLHAFTGDGRRHMEYARERGIYVDLPFETVMAGLREAYTRIDLA